MHVLHAKLFSALITNLVNSVEAFGRKAGALSVEDKKQSKNAEIAICMMCQAINCPVTEEVAKNLSETETFERLTSAFNNIHTTLVAELKSRSFYGPLAEYEKYFQQSTLFGDEVFNAYPSAAEDIAEAGTCLALERGTACVMHLMRALEAALSALAKALNIAPQNDWGSYLRLIEKELTSRTKSSGVRTSEEQFFAEAATQFDYVRRAWRNPTMHIEKTYTPERAEEILRSVKSFMSHLATKISE